ncbi:MAG: 30S ribosomal protein S12 methylthiotransferase RimO [bacterium]
MEHKTVGLISLGCAKNLVDSEHMLGSLLQEGYFLTADPKQASILIVNTCSFITEAKQEAVDTILEMAEYKTKGKCQKLIVTGCLAQHYAKELSDQLPEVDAVLGTGVLAKLPLVLSQLKLDKKVIDVGPPGGLLEGPRLLTTPPGSAYLKLAEGCHHHCTYCIIPKLRGSLTSRPIEDIVAEGERLADQGIQELILIAQDTTSYGIDLYGECRLPTLLRKLARISGLRWLRLLYLYPEYVSDALLTVMAEESKVCSYLDIPMQHASDRILKAMGRSSTRDSLTKLLNKVRLFLPDAAIRTTFIVGFPGETEADFRELMSFVQEQRFDWVGVFPYSPQKDAPSYRLPNQIPDVIKKERYQKLLYAQSFITKSCNKALLGKSLPVLIEKKISSGAIGRCFRQAPEVDGLTYVIGSFLEPGQMVEVNIERATTYDLEGRVASESTQ